MKWEKKLISQKQLHRYQVMVWVKGEKIILKEAGERIGVSYREANHTRKAVRQKTVKGLIHGNVARFPSNQIPEWVRERAEPLSQKKY